MSAAERGAHDERRMTLMEHLEELRACVFRALLGLAAATAGALWFQKELFVWVSLPHQRAMEKIGRPHEPLMALSYGEGIVAYMEVALVAGFILAGPWIVLQMWSFIRAGLYPRERTQVTRFFLASVLLFASGVAFGYLWLIPYCLTFLASYPSPTQIMAWIRLEDYLSMFFTMTFMIGIAFELPLVMLFLARIGLVSAAGFAGGRRWAVLGAFIVGAVFTPPDAVSQFALALPLCALYELGIILARTLGKPAEPTPG